VVVVDVVVVVTVVLFEEVEVVKLGVEDVLGLVVLEEIVFELEDVEDVDKGQGIGQSARNSRCKKVWTSSKADEWFKPLYHSGWSGKPCSIVQVAA
jgi:hypothetical protein